MNTAKLRKAVLLHLPYVFVLWLCARVGTAWRLAPGADIGAKLLGTVNSIGSYLTAPFARLTPQDLLVGLVGAAIFYGIVYVKGRNAKKYRKDVEYGSARWGNAKDIQPYMDEKSENNIVLTQTEGLTMNSRPRDPKTARNKNMLVVGGSGSGKTRFLIKPNLMQCESEDYPVSFVVTDPKGSLVVECGKMLQRYGYRIKVFNTINFAKSHKYNPFANIHSERDIMKMVNTFIANRQGAQKSSDPFWEQASVLLLTALSAYLHYEGRPEDKNFSTLADMVGAMEVREDDPDFKNVVDLMFDALAERDPDHFAVKQYRKFKLSAGKTAKSVLTTVGALLQPFDIKELQELTMYDELDLESLGDKKTALFLIMSDTDDTFNFLVSMVYSQIFNILCERADDVYGGRLPVHVRCLIDEAANIGKIPQLEKLMATIRSREISACLVLQAQSQLKGIYKDHAETISGNCDSTIFLGGREKTTLEELTKLLGKETIDLYNTSVTKGNQESHGQNYSKVGKELMTMDELSVLDGGKCILQLRGVRPFLSDKFDITQHKNYKYLADANPKNTFNIERHLSTRLRLRPEEEYEVYDFTDTERPA